MIFRTSSRDLDCTVRVSHLFENLSAHVEFDDGDVRVGPGDRVLVHGAPIKALFGEVKVERRRATLTRASRLEHLWLRWTGDFACLSLLEVGFSREDDI